MPKLSSPRKGSLQFYPRKRASKLLHRVNWTPILNSVNEANFPLGFIAYKVGMASAIVKDLTEKSMTQKKRIALPVTILETPPMKILSVRFYKNNKILKDVIISNEKELKRKIKISKTKKGIEEFPQDYDDLRILVYSLVKDTSIKKTPDIIEIAIPGTKEEKLNYVKSILDKKILISDFLKFNLIDIGGITKGKGTQGPVKRFGITLRPHKSEKGVRKVGSIGPWHPARVTFRVPMAGQTGFFSRIVLNNNIILSKNIKEYEINPGHGFKNYGKIKTFYLIIKGSVPGPSKRQLILTPSFRPSKKQLKKKYEFIRLVIK